MLYIATQKGNVLFLILIAVVLFAALAFVVSSSMRSNPGSVSEDKAKLIATQMVQFGNTLTNSAMRLIMSNGCTNRNLNFYHSGFARDFTNNDAPADGSCNIFGPNGASVPAMKPPQGAVPAGTASPNNEYFYVGCMEVWGVGTSGTGEPSKELLVQAIVTREVCLQINEKMGITNTGGNPPVWDYGVTEVGWCQYGHPILGAYQDAIGVGRTDIAGYAPELYGTSTGCYQSNADDLYRFYHVVIPR